MDQLSRLDTSRHALNDRLVHVKHIQQEQISPLAGGQLGIGNRQQQGLHGPNGFTDDDAPLTAAQRIKQVLFGDRAQLGGTTIQVTLMHTCSFQVPGPLPQVPYSASIYLYLDASNYPDVQYFTTLFRHLTAPAIDRKSTRLN